MQKILIVLLFFVFVVPILASTPPASTSATAWCEDIVDLFESSKNNNGAGAASISSQQDEKVHSIDKKKLQDETPPPPPPYPHPDLIQQHKGDGQFVNPLVENGLSKWWTVAELEEEHRSNWKGCKIVTNNHHQQDKGGVNEEKQVNGDAASNRDIRKNEDNQLEDEAEVAGSRKEGDAATPPAHVQCEWPFISMAIVMAAPLSHFDIIESNIASWAHPDFYPCRSESAATTTATTTDLVIFSPHSDLLPAARRLVLSKLSSSPELEKMRKTCFRDVRFLSADISRDVVSSFPSSPSDARVHPSPASLLFSRLFENRQFNTTYSHFFWMGVGAIRPVRQGWINHLLEEAALHFPAWVVGGGLSPDSSVRRGGGDNVCGLHRSDYEFFNIHSLYRTNSSLFRRFVHRSLRQRPDSIEKGMTEYLTRCDYFHQTQRLVHMFHFSEIVATNVEWNDKKTRNLSTFLAEHPNTFFLHGWPSVALMTGVTPCGVENDARYWPLPFVFPPDCPKWDTSRVLSISQIDSQIEPFSSLPSSPWGPDLSFDAAIVWEEALRHSLLSTHNADKSNNNNFADEDTNDNNSSFFSSLLDMILGRKQKAKQRREDIARLKVLLRVPEYRAEWCRAIAAIDCGSTKSPLPLDSNCWDRCWEHFSEIQSKK